MNKLPLGLYYEIFGEMDYDDLMLLKSVNKKYEMLVNSFIDSFTDTNGQLKRKKMQSGGALGEEDKKDILFHIFKYKLFGYTANERKSNARFNAPHVTDVVECGSIQTINYEGNEKLEIEKDYTTLSFDLPIIRSCDPLSSNDTPKQHSNKADKAIETYEQCNPKNSVKSKLGYPDENLLCETSSNFMKDFIKNISDATTKMLDIRQSEIEKEGSYIYKIQLNKLNNKYKKVVIVGDLHGGFHTFYRLMLRFVINGYITENNLSENGIPEYTVNPDYLLIFCGDILDRGAYGMEIITILLKLIINSNMQDDIRIIYNRGNHEESTQYGSSNEGTFGYYSFPKDCAIKDIQHVMKIFGEFMESCPCAVILEYINEEVEIDRRIWVCHGGVPFINCKTNMENIKDISHEYIEIEGQTIIGTPYNCPFDKSKKCQTIPVNANLKNQIMWQDFSGFKYTIPNIARGKDCAMLGSTMLNQFLEENEIDFIVRGHQDNYSNTLLFEYDKKSDDPLGNLSYSMLTDNINQVLSDKQSPLFDENSGNSYDGPIAILSLKKFITTPELYKKVITISTNTGYGRSLTNDSFLLLEMI